MLKAKTLAINSCRNTATIPSAIKWTGSKRSQASIIASLSPHFDRYIEPFLGGGAMLYLAAHPGAIGNDIYNPLISLWKMIRDDPAYLIEQYRFEWNKLNTELDEFNLSKMVRGKGIPKTFYAARDRFNQRPNAVDLNFLMRTCVNGIVRFNGRGEFNNSFHLSRRGMKPESFAAVIKSWQPILQGVELTNHDYEEVLDRANRGDFVYLDPPYAGNKQRYAKSLSPQKLFIELEKLNNRGVNWALSYDGLRGDKDLTYDIPKSLFKTRHYLHSGNSAVKKVLSGPIERVEEALYLNY